MAAVDLNGAAEPGLDIASVEFTNALRYTDYVSSVCGGPANVAEQVIVNPAGVSPGFYTGLTISGVAGYSYIIQSANDPADTNSWQTLTSLSLTFSTQLWIDTSVDASFPFISKVYYRVLPGQ